MSTPFARPWVRDPRDVPGASRHRKTQTRAITITTPCETIGIISGSRRSTSQNTINYLITEAIPITARMGTSAVG